MVSAPPPDRPARAGRRRAVPGRRLVQRRDPICGFRATPAGAAARRALPRPRNLKRTLSCSKPFSPPWRSSRWPRSATRRCCWRSCSQRDCGQHWAILGGILGATIANHALAALVGQQVAGLVDAPWFRAAVAIGFIAMAAWTLAPTSSTTMTTPSTHRGGAFLTTLVAFFVVEMGDKTQVATIALGAQYHSVLAVASGTTLGMMLANGPAVFLAKSWSSGSRSRRRAWPPRCCSWCLACGSLARSPDGGDASVKSRAPRNALARSRQARRLLPHGLVRQDHGPHRAARALAGAPP